MSEEESSKDLFIKVGMVGPSGSGKTSLLTALYNETQERIRDNRSGIQFWPADESTQKAMKRALAAFTACVSSPDGLFDIPEMKPSQDETHFCFDFTVPCPELNNESQKVNVDIMDYPGGLVGSSKFTEFVFPHLRQSVALLVPVSTDMLMTYVENANQKNSLLRKKCELALQALDVHSVHEIIQQWITSLTNDNKYGTLIFVPVKCEKWFDDNGGAKDDSQKIFDAIKELYKIEELFKSDLGNQVKIACFSVDTYGIVEFQGTELDTMPNGEEKLKSTFLRRDLGNKVKSKNACEVLLTILVSFLSNEAHQRGISYKQLSDRIQNRGVLGSLIKKIQTFLGHPDKEKETLDEYIQKHKVVLAALDELKERFRKYPCRQKEYKEKE